MLGRTDVDHDLPEVCNGLTAVPTVCSQRLRSTSYHGLRARFARTSAPLLQCTAVARAVNIELSPHSSRQGCFMWLLHTYTHNRSLR